MEYNKIVASPSQIFDNDLDVQVVGHNGAEEYIRKEALLEWAKAELSHANANIEAYPYENAYRGHREKIEELIEHIESL